MIAGSILLYYSETNDLSALWVRLKIYLDLRKNGYADNGYPTSEMTPALLLNSNKEVKNQCIHGKNVEWVVQASQGVQEGFERFETYL